MKKIWLAGGCFWGVEAYFAQLKGVEHTEVGYAQGNKDIVPTYELVCTGTTGYTETVEIVYNPNEITLSTLLLHMFRFVDPTSLNQQGNDRGTQYRSGIYFEDAEDEAIIKDFLTQMQAQFSSKIVVECEPLTSYYSAEAYHQEYLLKNPTGYCHVNLNLVKPEERK